MRGVLVATLAMAACTSHVHVPPLPGDMSADQRVAAFHHWRRRAIDIEWSERCRGLLHGCTSDSTHTLVLGSGMTVTEGDDLIPLLEPSSTAGRAAADIVRRRKHQRFWTWFGIGTVAAGVAVAVIGMQRDPDAKVPVLGIVGGGVIAAGFTGGYVMHRYHRKRIGRASAIVFAHYDESLARRLRLCVSGMAVVACETLPR